MDFYRAMREARVPAQLRIRDGVHNWEYWHTSLRMALPFASRNFSR
jgi:S-formylglutathione hydrolase FrmB